MPALELGPASPDPDNASAAAYSFTASTSPPTSDSSLDLRKAGQVHRNIDPATTQKQRPRWMRQVKDWLATSEPSARAMKEQKASTFKKHGIAMNDPQAAAKLHLSMEKVPVGATTSTSGPTPEKAFKQRAANSRARDSLGGRGSQCGSSGSSLRPASKDHRIAPWEG